MSELATTTTTGSPLGHALALAGQAANEAARGLTWREYLASRTASTLRAQLSDLASFSEFLAAVQVADAPTGERLQNEPAAWQGVSHGLVLAFREWLMGKGYAIATVNRRLATVKVYASLSEANDEKIAAIRGFGHKQGRNRDAKRVEAGTPTRVGFKKMYKAISLSYEQAHLLKRQPNTPQGRRDAFLMCLLLDHGLRCGEVALLTVEDFDAAAGTLNFYRPKVDKRQTHRLTGDTLVALRAWLSSGDAPATGPILRTSRKSGTLTTSPATRGMTARAITGRVRELGLRLGIPNLSAHDCRHCWATRATQAGTHPKSLQQAGGWNSPAMVMRYVDEAEVANEGVRL